jgi:hypothetical protein
MHVNAMSATVELGGSQLCQLEKSMVETAAADEGVQAVHGPVGFGRSLSEIESSFHGHLPSND